MGNAGRGKSDVDWAIHRAKQGPGPGQYNVNASYCYLDGTAHDGLPGRRGAIMLGRTGPANMPEPFKSLGDAPEGYRYGPSGSHEEVRCQIVGEGPGGGVFH
jgi:hypothetical protein